VDIGVLPWVLANIRLLKSAEEEELSRMNLARCSPELIPLQIVLPRREVINPVRLPLRMNSNMVASAVRPRLRNGIDHATG